MQDRTEYELGLQLVDGSLEQSMLHPGTKEQIVTLYPPKPDATSVLANVC